MFLVKQPILPNVKSTKISGDKVVEEINVLGVLSIKPLILLLVKQPILPNIKSTKISGDKVVEEVNVLGILSINH